MEEKSVSVDGDAKELLRGYIERIERLEEEKKAIAEDIKDIYTVAKSKGFDTRIMRKIVAARKKDPTEIEEEQAMFDLYMSILKS